MLSWVKNSFKSDIVYNRLGLGTQNKSFRRLKIFAAYQEDYF